MVYQTQMLRNATLAPYELEPFTPAPHIVATNILFFSSLAIVLVAAFVSMLVKGWVREFDRGLEGISELRRRAIVREYRVQGIERWKLSQIINFLPGLIYLSLLIFFVGLFIFLFDIQKASAIATLAIFALGVLFYVLTTAISIFNDAAPFRSPLSRALGRGFRRLYSALRLPRFSRALINRAADISSLQPFLQFLSSLLWWKPCSEDDLHHSDGSMSTLPPGLEIETSAKALNRIYTSTPRGPSQRAVFTSIVLASHPLYQCSAKVANTLLRHINILSVDLDGARAIATSLCTTSVIRLAILHEDLLHETVGHLARSLKPWDQTLAYLLRSKLPRAYRDGASLYQLQENLLESLYAMIPSASGVIFLANALKISTISLRHPPETGPEPAPPTEQAQEDSAALRILAYLMYTSYRYGSLVDMVVHQLLDTFLTISDMPSSYGGDFYVVEKEDLFSPSVSYQHSPPSLVYHPDILIEIIEWGYDHAHTDALLRGYREFSHALIGMLQRRFSAEIPRPRHLDFSVSLPHFPHLEGIALAAPVPDPQIDLIFVVFFINSLDPEAMVEPPDEPDEIIALYDWYLNNRGAKLHPAIQRLISRVRLRSDDLLDRDPRPFSTITIQHPWLAVHVDTLMERNTPIPMSSELQWDDNPALDMIACDRLDLYDSGKVRAEAHLVSVFLHSASFQTVLGAFKYYVRSLSQSIDSSLSGTELDDLHMARVMATLFDHNANHEELVLSWTVLLDFVLHPWESLPSEWRHRFAAQFFGSTIQNQTDNGLTVRECCGMAWVEAVWYKVIKPSSQKVWTSPVDMRWSDLSRFNRGNGEVDGVAGVQGRWERPDGELFTQLALLEEEEAEERKKEEEENAEQERARWRKAGGSVGHVLPTLATLLGTADHTDSLTIETVRRVRDFSLLPDDLLPRDHVSMERIQAIVEQHTSGERYLSSIRHLFDEAEIE